MTSPAGAETAAGGLMPLEGIRRGRRFAVGEAVARVEDVEPADEGGLAQARTQRASGAEDRGRL